MNVSMSLAAENFCLSFFLVIIYRAEHLTVEDKHHRKNGQQTISLDPLFIPLNTNTTRKRLLTMGLPQVSTDNGHHFVWQWCNVKHYYIVAGLKSSCQTYENCWNNGVLVCIVFHSWTHILVETCWSVQNIPFEIHRTVWLPSEMDLGNQSDWDILAKTCFQIWASRSGQSAGSAWALLTIPLDEICTEANDVCITLRVSCCADSIAEGIGLTWRLLTVMFFFFWTSVLTWSPPTQQDVKNQQEEMLSMWEDHSEIFSN